MKAETTVNGPQASPKTASTGTRQTATSRKRAASGIAPRKSASGGYNDGVGGWKWEMSGRIIPVRFGGKGGFIMKKVPFVLTIVLLICLTFFIGCRSPSQKTTKSSGSNTNTTQEDKNLDSDLVIDKVGFVPLGDYEKTNYWLVARITNNNSNYGCVRSSYTGTLYNSSGVVVGSTNGAFIAIYPKQQSWIVSSNPMGDGTAPARADYKVSIGSWARMSESEIPKIEVVQKNIIDTSSGSSSITGVFRYSGNQPLQQVIVYGLPLNANGDPIAAGLTIFHNVAPRDQPFEIQLNVKPEGVADIAISTIAY